jgi:hypothetical protein
VHQHQCLNNRQIANNSDCALQVVVKRLKQSDLFTQRTGQSMPAIQQQLNKAQALGLLELNDKHIQPSEKGFNFLKTDIFIDWLPSEQCSMPLDTTTSLAFANAINTRKNKDRKTSEKGFNFLNDLQIIFL